MSEPKRWTYYLLAVVAQLHWQSSPKNLVPCDFAFKNMCEYVVQLLPGFTGLTVEGGVGGHGHAGLLARAY